jgi:hypothetical protein
VIEGTDEKSLIPKPTFKLSSSCGLDTLIYPDARGGEHIKPTDEQVRSSKTVLPTSDRRGFETGSE